MGWMPSLIFMSEQRPVACVYARSTTVLLAALDNSTRIHGKVLIAGNDRLVRLIHELHSAQLHPMIAVLSIGDCELLMLSSPHRRAYCTGSLTVCSWHASAVLQEKDERATV